MSRTRAAWEPARTLVPKLALAANFEFFDAECIVLWVQCTNTGATAGNVKVYDGETQIGSLAVPAGETKYWPEWPGAQINKNLNITPSEAMDITAGIA